MSLPSTVPCCDHVCSHVGVAWFVQEIAKFASLTPAEAFAAIKVCDARLFLFTMRVGVRTSEGNTVDVCAGSVPLDAVLGTGASGGKHRRVR